MAASGPSPGFASVLVDAELQPLSATRQALQAVGCSDLDALRAGWSRLREAVDRARDSGGSVRCRLGEADLSLAVEDLVAEGHGARYLVWIGPGARSRDLDDALFLALRTANYLELCRPMAHAIRGPLNAIALNVELLRDLTEDRSMDPERARALTLRTVEVLDRSFESLNGLLELHLRATGRPGAEPSRFGLRTLLGEACAPIGTFLTDRGIALALPPESPDPPLLGRKDRLGTALTTVLVRALRQATEGDTLRVTLEQDDAGPRLEASLEGPIETPRSGGPDLGPFALEHETLRMLLAEFDAGLEARRGPRGALVQRLTFRERVS